MAIKSRINREILSSKDATLREKAVRTKKKRLTVYCLIKILYIVKYQEEKSWQEQEFLSATVASI